MTYPMRIPTLHFQQISELFLQTQQQLAFLEDKMKGTARFAHFEEKVFGMHLHFTAQVPIRFNWVYEGLNSFVVGLFRWDEATGEVETNTVLWDGISPSSLTLAQVFPNLQLEFQPKQDRRILLLFFSVYALDDQWSMGKYTEVLTSPIYRQRITSLFESSAFQMEVRSLMRLLGPDIYFPQEIISTYLGACFDVARKVWQEEEVMSQDSVITHRLIESLCEVRLYEKPLSGTEYAARLGMSLRQLNTFCLNQYKLSFLDYFHKRRFEQAKSWLEMDSLSIAEVARRLHFKNAFYFTKKFEEYMGCPPKSFRVKQTFSSQNNAVYAN